MSGGTLHDEPPVTEQQRAQAGKLFTTAGPPRAAMQATGHYVAVPGMLAPDGGINHECASVQIADAEDQILIEGCIIRKHRRHKRS
jgi:hypothetical protein